MPSIFINYWTASEHGIAALLYRELAAHFGAREIFFASSSVAPGDDFQRSILRAVRSAKVMLTVVGPDRSAAERADGARVAHHCDDPIRREIALAFVCEVRVIPVLVNDAPRISESELPQDIRRLAQCQSMRFRYDAGDRDLRMAVERTVAAVRSAQPRKLGVAPSQRSVPAVMLAVLAAVFSLAAAVLLKQSLYGQNGDVGDDPIRGATEKSAGASSEGTAGSSPDAADGMASVAIVTPVAGQRVPSCVDVVGVGAVPADRTILVGVYAPQAKRYYLSRTVARSSDLRREWVTSSPVRVGNEDSVGSSFRIFVATAPSSLADSVGVSSEPPSYRQDGLDGLDIRIVDEVTVTLDRLPVERC